MHRTSYVPHRRLLYALLWLTAVVELGLTAYRIHFTRKTFGTHDGIVAELLFASILTLLWVPLTLLLHRSASSSNSNSGSGNSNRSGGHLGFLHGETSGNFILWILWLVGAAIATHKWPTRALAGPGKQGNILTAIIALAWIAFSLLTLAKILAAMEYAARNAVGHDGASSGSGSGSGTGTGHGHGFFGRDKAARGAGHNGAATTV